MTNMTLSTKMFWSFLLLLASKVVVGDEEEKPASSSRPFGKIYSKVMI